MCALKKVGSFIKKGFATFRNASQGSYKQDSKAISEIRKEILEKNNGRGEDKKNLLYDRKNVEGDVHKSLKKVVLNNG